MRRSRRSAGKTRGPKCATRSMAVSRSLPWVASSSSSGSYRTRGCSRFTSITMTRVTSSPTATCRPRWMESGPWATSARSSPSRSRRLWATVPRPRSRRRCTSHRLKTPREPDLSGYVDPDQAGRQRQHLAAVQGESQRTVAVRRGPEPGVSESFVEDLDSTTRVEIEVVDMRSVTVSDIEQRLLRVQDDQHLDPQRLAEALVDVGMSLFGLLIGAEDRVVVLYGVVLVDVDRRRRGAAGQSRPRLWDRERRDGSEVVVLRGLDQRTMDHQVVRRVARRPGPELVADRVEELRRGVLCRPRPRRL